MWRTPTARGEYHKGGQDFKTKWVLRTGGRGMGLSADYFARLQELLESAEEAYTTTNFEEAGEFLEEIRLMAVSGIEDLEEVKLEEVVDTDE
jgi:hypothetical protein